MKYESASEQGPYLLQVVFRYTTGLVRTPWRKLSHGADSAYGQLISIRNYLFSRSRGFATYVKSKLYGMDRIIW